MVVSIGISFIAILARAIILYRLVELPILKYVSMIFKLSLVTMIIYTTTRLSINISESKWVQVSLSSIISTLLHCLLYLLIIPQLYRNKIFAIVKTKFIRK